MAGTHQAFVQIHSLVQTLTCVPINVRFNIQNQLLITAEDAAVFTRVLDSDGEPGSAAVPVVFQG